MNTALNQAKALELFDSGERGYDANGGVGGCCTQCQAECCETIEPDSSGFLCDECGARRVMGMEAYLMAFLPL